MFALAIGAWFAPSELPNIGSTLPFRSYHASVLHKCPFCSGVVCPSTWSTIAGTIQAQIVAPTTQKCAINVGEDGEVIAFLRRCPTVEKGGAERGELTELHGASFQSVGAPNSFAKGFERVDNLWIISMNREIQCSQDENSLPRQSALWPADVNL